MKNYYQKQFLLLLIFLSLFIVIFRINYVLISPSISLLMIFIYFILFIISYILSLKVYLVLLLLLFVVVDFFSRNSAKLWWSKLYQHLSISLFTFLWWVFEISLRSAVAISPRSSLFSWLSFLLLILVSLICWLDAPHLRVKKIFTYTSSPVFPSLRIQESTWTYPPCAWCTLKF